MFRKTLRPQFSKLSLAIESAVFWYIWNTADTMARLNSENYGRKVLRNTALVLLATRVLPASPNLGQAKQGQKGPAATFCPKCVCSPMYTSLFTFYGPSQCLWAEGRRVKDFSFSRICMSACSIFLSACFDATDLPLASLNRYIPKFSGVPQKMACCQ